jgi:hypothetical protein
MSAFSNWNGPDCGGGSLPQIRTLEELIRQIDVVEGHIITVRDNLKNHIDKDSTVGLHEVLQRNYNEKFNSVITSLSTEISKVLTIADTANTTATNAATQNDLDLEIAARETGDATLKQTDEQIAYNLNLLKTSFETFQSNLTDTLSVETLTVKDIKALENDTINILAKTTILKDVITRILKVDTYMDFIHWSETSGHIFAVADAKTKGDVDIGINSNQVLIVGTLSTEFTDEQAAIPSEKAHKAARVFLKYIDDRPWDAVVDLTATKSWPNGIVSYSGAINGISSLSTDRKGIKFGVYRGTRSGGTERMYLGIATEETSAMSYASQLSVKVAGINFIPFSALLGNMSSLLPTGSLYEITSTIIRHRPDSDDIMSDNYLDATGGNVLITNRDNDTLTLGKEDLPRQLIMWSAGRPTIYYDDKSEYKMAFLSDLAQSVFWQRSVVVATTTSAELDALEVFVDSGGHIVSPTAQGATAVPGIYTTDPSDSQPNGYVFATDDVALVMESANKVQIPDGRLNDVISGVEQKYSKSLLTEVDLDHIKIGTTFLDATTPTPLLGQITSILGNDIYAKAITQTPTIPFEYTLPSYFTFDGAAWGDEETIDIPKTSDGIIHDITYEWSGEHVKGEVVISGTTYNIFVESYLTWTAHHANNSTMEYDGKPWDFVDLNMDSYRTKGRQNEIDNSIISLATTQSDYGEIVPTALLQVPEHPSVTIPNPSYIHHRPWRGLAILDGGSFETPSIYADWFVDGGDFTGMANSVYNSLLVGAVPAENQFRNVIMRIWHGDYAQMPEVISPLSSNTAWNTYRFTFRFAKFTTDASYTDNVLYLSDGFEKKLLRYEAITAYKNTTPTVIQSFTIVPNTITSLQFQSKATDFSEAGKPELITTTWTLQSDVVDGNGTLNFAVVSSNINVSSPRMTAIESSLTTINSSIATLQAKLPTPPTTGGPYMLMYTPSTNTYSWEE